MKKMIVAIMAVALLATSGVAIAQGWGRGAGMGYGPCAAGVNLSAEQIQQMQEMRKKFFDETASLREEMFQKNADLRSLWAQPNPDPSAISEKQKEINALRTQMQTLATQHRLEARKVLTPEQQAQLQNYLSDTANQGPGYGKRGGPGRGWGMGPGGCPRW